MKTAEIIRLARLGGLTDVWVKVEAGYYVHTTDDGYTATVRKMGHGSGWAAEATSPSGKVRTRQSYWNLGLDTMAEAREWALGQIDHLVQQDETELVAQTFADHVAVNRKSEVTMSGPGDQTASFLVYPKQHCYKVTVERWNG